MPKLYLLYIALYVSLTVASIAVDVSWGLYLHMGIYFVSPWTKWWGADLPEIRWVLIIAVVNVVGFLIHRRLYAGVRIRDSRPLCWLMAFTAVIVLVTPLAVWPERHWLIVDKQIKVVVFLILLYKVISSGPKLEKLIWVYLTGVFYVGWVAYETGRSGGGQLEGVGPADSTDANDLGAIFVTAVPLLLFYVMQGKKTIVRVLAVMFLPFVLNGLILVNSRGAAVGTLVAVTLFLIVVLFSKEQSATLKLKVIVGVIACTGMFFYLTDPTFWRRQSTLTTAVKSDGAESDSDFKRVRLWIYALSLVADHPLGVGGMGYTRLSSNFLPDELIGDSEGKAIHSTYFEALTAYGYVGFILFVIFIVSVFRELRIAQKQLPAGPDESYRRLQGYALMSAYAGFLVSAIFINRLYCEVMYYFPVFFSIYRSAYASAPIAVAAAPARLETFSWSSAKSPLAMKGSAAGTRPR